jgi:hypothetical protein
MAFSARKRPICARLLYATGSKMLLCARFGPGKENRPPSISGLPGLRNRGENGVSGGCFVSRRGKFRPELRVFVVVLQGFIRLFSDLNVPLSYLFV